MDSLRLRVHSLPEVDYADGLELQRLQSQALGEGKAPDALFLLEHPPVFTFGRAIRGEHLLAPRSELQQRGFQTFETARGGDITYHGPGQLVGYPILQLEGARRDVRAYVRGLEETLIRTLADLGIEAFREEKWPGVWTRDRGGALAKVAALGVHIAKWRTGHGFALNLNPDLSHFELIVPCGIREAGVTSVSKLLGRPVERAEVEPRLISHFGRVFGYSDVEAAPVPTRTVAVAVLRREGAEAPPSILLLRRTPRRGGFWQLVTGRIERDESELQAAQREVHEETGHLLQPVPLGYRHAFAFGETAPPAVIEEVGFGALCSDSWAPVLDPGEHDAYEWLNADEAIERLPFAGLRETARRAAALFFSGPGAATSIRSPRE